MGHIARACQTKQSQRPQQKQPARRAHYIDDTEPEPNPTTTDTSYNLFTVTGSGQTPIMMQVTINQTPIQMELDTGASQQCSHENDSCSPEDLHW